MDSARQELPPILYQDEAIIALDKPSGLLVAPDRWDKCRVHLVQLLRQADPGECRNVHRLDRDASGVVLCARTAGAIRGLRAAFDARQVRKEYLAIVSGAPKADRGQVDAPILPDPRRAGRMCVGRLGKPSCTRFEVLERWRGGLALIRLLPLTGRTHQLRVHMAHIGCPILGDALYGDGRGLFLSELKAGYKPGRRPEPPLIARLALHAAGLTFQHPTTRQPITIQSPLPKDFRLALKNLRRYGR